MKNIQTLLAEYGASHQNPKNKFIHIVCVPLIFFSIMGMIYNIQVQHISLIYFVLPFVLFYYFKLSLKSGLYMLIFIMLNIEITMGLYQWWGNYSYYLYGAIFIISWIFQFVGHEIEGVKPSFFKDLQFLLIGPLFVIQKVMKADF